MAEAMPFPLRLCLWLEWGVSFRRLPPFRNERVKDGARLLFVNQICGRNRWATRPAPRVESNSADGGKRPVSSFLHDGKVTPRSTSANVRSLPSLIFGTSKRIH
jgi:hypothetical protein